MTHVIWYKIRLDQSMGQKMNVEEYFNKIYSDKSSKDRSMSLFRGISEGDYNSFYICISQP